MTTEQFKDELAGLLNKHSIEAGSDTPDFILASYLANCLRAWNEATLRRDKWYMPAEEYVKMLEAKAPERDPNRCGVCAWPLVEKGGEGCWRGNCSERPVPPLSKWYDPVRYAREQEAPDHAKGEA